MNQIDHDRPKHINDHANQAQPQPHSGHDPQARPHAAPSTPTANATRTDAQNPVDAVKASWDSLTGQARETWRGLTEDECRQADGSVDRLSGVIATRFGETKDSVRAKLDKFAAR